MPVYVGETGQFSQRFTKRTHPALSKFEMPKLAIPFVYCYRGRNSAVSLRTPRSRRTLSCRRRPWRPGETTYVAGRSIGTATVRCTQGVASCRHWLRRQPLRKVQNGGSMPSKDTSKTKSLRKNRSRGRVGYISWQGGLLQHTKLRCTYWRGHF